MEKPGKIIPSLIIGISIIISVIIFSFKNEIKLLVKGPDMAAVKKSLAIPDVGFTESLKQTFDIWMEHSGMNAQHSDFISFRNTFLTDESKLMIPFMINESIVWLPMDQKEEILMNEASLIACKVFIYKQDTLFVPEKKIKKFQEAVPRARLLF